MTKAIDSFAAEWIENIGLLVEQGDVAKAKKTIDDALESLSGEDGLVVAGFFFGLGDKLFENSQFKDAMQTYKAALEIRLELLGDRHPDTAESYETVGNVFYKEADFESAEEMYRKALEIDLEVQPDNHLVLSDRYYDMGTVLTDQGKIDEAIKMCKQSLARKLHIHGGEDHSDIAWEYIGVGVLLMKQNRLDDALQMCDRVIEMCNRLGPGGDNRKILAAALINQALIRQKQGDLEAATELCEQSLAIQVEVFGEMHLETADFYQNIAVMYGKQDRLDDAIHASFKAFQIHGKELGEDHPYTAECFKLFVQLKLGKAAAINEEGLALAKAGGDYTHAVKLFQEALSMYSELELEEPDTAAVYENMADVYISADKLEDAVATSAGALKIYRRKLGDDHEVTKRRMEEHRSLLKRLLENRS
eukprot:CAMPEP_0113632124 /NCGR_PEP_ID=MMETSP0017_2-20120614/16694_1 /TAXON_ID=2856 /ORGANISM="Cylindrotheca closterium" /LENGTH=419 /DNA_ID=CAMNT_0000542661 /DNA_START=184 /DNA_END=1443 /DNA_ORIENTATION=- /assembly_acc=CAM_ASM_000147